MKYFILLFLSLLGIANLICFEGRAFAGLYPEALLNLAATVFCAIQVLHWQKRH